MSPKNATNYMNLGSAYGTSGDFRNAIESFKKALEITPNDAQIYYFIGITYQSLGDKENAKIYLDKAQAMQGKK